MYTEFISRRKMMRLKKLLALGMATTFVFASTMTAFADDTVVKEADTAGAYSATVTVTDTITTPIINVTVPTSTSFTIDPYEIAGEGQIVSTGQTIINKSNVGIAVGATLTGKIDTAGGSGVTLASAALKGTETTKSAFLYLNVVEGVVDTEADGYDADDDTTWTIKEKTAGTLSAAYDSKSTSQIVLATKAATKAGMVTLAAANYKNNDGEVQDEYQSDATYAMYKICGSVATKPASAWTSKDTVGVDLVFTFVPQTTKAASSSN
jgi:hypothetical protein